MFEEARLEITNLRLRKMMKVNSFRIMLTHDFMKAEAMLRHNFMLAVVILKERHFFI